MTDKPSIPFYGLLLSLCFLCNAEGDLVSASQGGMELKADRKTGEVLELRHQPSQHSWLQQPFSLFQITGGEMIAAELSVEAVADGVELNLRLINRSGKAQSVTPTFPNLQFAGSDSEDHALLRYCFPVRSALIGREKVSDRGFYSGIAPLQFFAVDHPTGGSIHAVICDQKNTRKLFGLDKTDEVLRLFVEHETRTLAPGEEWLLQPVLLATGSGTWHDGLTAYRRCLATWYRPAVPRSEEFRKIFNFRVFYAHHDSPLRSDILSPQDQSWALDKAVERDQKLFGGIDFVHLFDWSKTPGQGRVGDYAPWDHQPGGLANFRNQLAELEEKGIPTGLYLEGYLAAPESEVAKKHGEEWAMIDAEGKRVDTWGGGYTTMCPHMPGWQDYLANTCKRLAAETGAKGAYIDQFGFLTQYRCYNPAHAEYHAMGSHMLAGEAGMLQKTRAAVGAKMVLYTEEIPTDYMTQFTDGAYTASVNISLSRGIKCPINLTRFALPGFKTIELISENGIGDNLPGVRASFFNGEGLYLSGDGSLFSPACLELIAKTHGILRRNVENFIGMNPEPLVPTLSPDICVNWFPMKRHELWTLLNTADVARSGPVLKIHHHVGARYRDEWNGLDLTPEITSDGHAIISLSMESAGVGCIVQSW